MPVYSARGCFEKAAKKSLRGWGRYRGRGRGIDAKADADSDSDPNPEGMYCSHFHAR